MKILLTNDDGINAPGLWALQEVLEPMGEVIIVAPGTEQSGVGHAITYREPITAERAYITEGQDSFVVHGTPADCVKFGMLEVMDDPPDFVCSGINFGLNVGCNVFYSGTVAAAIEATMYGVTSIAFSSVRDGEAEVDMVARNCVRTFQMIRDVKNRYPVAFNVNFPGGTDTDGEIAFTDQWDRAFDEHYLSESADGSRYMLHLPWEEQDSPSQKCDVTAIKEGLISITPLRPRLTDTELLDSMKK